MRNRMESNSIKKLYVALALGLLWLGGAAVSGQNVLWTESFEGYALSGAELGDQDGAWTEHFINDPTSWHNTIQDGQFSDGAQALEVFAERTDASWCYHGVVRDLNSIGAIAGNGDRTMRVTVDAKVPVKVSNEVYIRLYDLAGALLTEFNWNNDHWVWAMVGGTVNTKTSKYLGAVTTWVTVSFELDSESNTFDLYVDGTLAADDWSLGGTFSPGGLGDLILESKYWVPNGTVFFDNIIVDSWSPACGDPGTVYLPADVSGPAGEPDCFVDLMDFAFLAGAWLECSDPANPACTAGWYAGGS